MSWTEKTLLSLGHLKNILDRKLFQSLEVKCWNTHFGYISLWADQMLVEVMDSPESSKIQPWEASGTL